MEDKIKYYFSPWEDKERGEYFILPSQSFRACLKKPDYEESLSELGDCDLALIAINDGDNLNFLTEVEAAFSKLAFIQELKIIDLGVLKSGKSKKDVESALAFVLDVLLQNGVKTFIYGSEYDYTHVLNKCIDKYQSNYSISIVDSAINLTDNPYKANLGNVTSESENLYNVSYLGLQLHYISDEGIAMLDSMNYDYFRLGKLKNNMKLLEAVFRDSSLVSFNLGAVRAKDFIGQKYPGVQGFTSYEACQVVRYSGSADKCLAFAVNQSCSSSQNSTDAELVAQLVWYFVDGLKIRIEEDLEKGMFVEYSVPIEDIKESLIFVKSRKTARWWLVLKDSGGQKHHYACDYEDYKLASNNEIPEVWLRNNLRNK